MSRQHRTIGWSVAWILAAAVLLPPARAHAQKKPGTSKPLPNIRYSLKFIGTPEVQPSGCVSPVNDYGEVVGNARFSDSPDGPYLYQAYQDKLIRLEDLVFNLVVSDGSGNTLTRQLTELPSTHENMGGHINNEGQVAARARVRVTNSAGSSTYYGEGCRLSPVGDPDPITGQYYLYESLGDINPVAINDDGVVVGWVGWTVVVSETPGLLRTIGQFNSDGTRPDAITGANAEGAYHIVGWTSNSGGWIWHPDGTWTQPTWSGGRANWVNRAVISNGRLLVTGSAKKSRKSAHAFRYTEGGAMEDLGNLDESSYGNGINVSGRVVGHCNSLSGRQRAFLYYDSTSGMTNLDNLIDHFGTIDDRDAWMSTSTRTSAVGINFDDAISGQGTFNDGAYRAFVLIPQGLRPNP